MSFHLDIGSARFAVRHGAGVRSIASAAAPSRARLPHLFSSLNGLLFGSEAWIHRLIKKSVQLICNCVA